MIGDGPPIDLCGGVTRVIDGEDILFGPFRLSTRTRSLSDGRGQLPLKSRAFDLLLTLIEHRDRVVLKGELMVRVWGDLFVGENNLHVQIAALRRLLGDGRRWILTVPGKGYRFIGEVRVGPTQPEAEADATARLAAATARFWFDAGLAGEARCWLADALDHGPAPAQADVLTRMQRRLTELTLEARGSGSGRATDRTLQPWVG